MTKRETRKALRRLADEACRSCREQWELEGEIIDPMPEPPPRGPCAYCVLYIRDAAARGVSIPRSLRRALK